MNISEPDALTYTLAAVENPLCPGDLSGSISVEAAGGTLPYDFLWSNGGTTSTITGLGTGVYNLVLTDANGCMQTASVTLVATDNEAPVLVLQNATVSLNAAGQANINPLIFNAGSSDNCGIVSGTVSPSSFDCSQLGTHPVTITATDANGNTATGTAMVTVVDNIAPTITCPANINAGYCNTTVVYNLPQVDDNCAVVGTNLQMTGGLPSGSQFPLGSTTQTFTYTDASGNSGTCSFNVFVGGPATVVPSSTNVNCAGACDGTATMTVNGGNAPFTITWSNGQTGATASGLCADPYSATVTDAAGCLQIFTVQIAQPNELQLAVDQVVHDENNSGVGSIGISVEGGTTPYSYNWTFNGQPFAMTQDLNGLKAGQYDCTVTDAKGCVISTQTITVENITGTSEPAWANTLALQPNPASGFVLFSVQHPLAQNMEVRFLDPTGRFVRTLNVAGQEKNMKIDLSDMPSGVYTVQFRSESEMVVRRLVITK